MATLPEGITTALVHMDAPLSFIGDPGRLHVEIEPSASLVWAATGTPVANFFDSLDLDSGQPLEISLPHTDQDGFLDGAGNSITGWFYTVKITYEKEGQLRVFPERDFQILAGQASVDLALVPAGAATVPQVAPILPVTSVEGFTGEVTLAILGLDQVDNTSDAQKVTSGPIAEALSRRAKVAKVLAHWERTLLESPATAKIALVGDSTYDSAAAGVGLHNALKAQIAGTAPLEGMVDANILNFGYNGQTTAQITSDEHMAALTAAAPNLIIAGPGINDIRATALTTAQLRAILVTGFNKIRAAVPGVPIIASIPNSFLTTDVGAAGYVVPNTDAQAKTDIIRAAYLSLIDEWPDVIVHDTQEEVFGRTSLATSPFMLDQIHPNQAGMNAKVAALVKLIGRTIPYSTGRIEAARVASPYSPWTVYGREVEDPTRYVKVAEGQYSSHGTGYLDFSYPGTLSGNITPYDIILMPDGKAYQIANSGWSILNQNSSTTRFLFPNGTITYAGPGSRGAVKVYRAATAVEAVVRNVQLNTGHRFKRYGRIVAGATNYVDIGSVSVTTERQNTPALEFGIQAGDILYADGNGAAPLTLPAPSAQGSNVRFLVSGTFDWGTLTGRLVVITGTHPADPVVASPNGTKYRIGVADDGALTTTSL